jgi:tyrosyl-tRNA synthetase
VKIFHGDKKAKKAEEYFVKTIQKKEDPDNIITEKEVIKELDIVELLVKYKLADSKSEARRLIQQGGIRINGKVENDIHSAVPITEEGTKIQRGKMKFLKIKLKIKRK